MRSLRILAAMAVAAFMSVALTSPAWADPEPSASPTPSASAASAPEVQAPAVQVVTVTCDPNYQVPSSGPCIPVAEDVNCGEIYGPVWVIGTDIYKLDKDKDGLACDDGPGNAGQSPAPPAPTQTTAGPPESPELPTTGADVATVAGIGLAVLIAGAAAVIFARRRRIN